MISVIIPAFNAEKTLRRTVSDILNQTYPDFELIIVDDGSTDSTSVICDELEKASEKVRVLHQANGGLSNARNNGTKAAVGDYVTYVDSDDRIAENYLSVLVTTLNTTHADIVCGQICRVPEGYEPKASSAESIDTVLFDKKQGIQEMLTGKKIWVGACCRLIPRLWMLEETFLDGKYYEDLSNTYRVNLKASLIAYVDVPLYFYVMKKGSITLRKETSAKQCMDYYEAITLCAKGCTDAFPDLKEDVAVLVARDYMSLYLHIHRCSELNDELKTIEKTIVQWMTKHWKIAAKNRKAPGNVRMRAALFGISPKLYEKIYYWGIKFAGKKIG